MASAWHTATCCGLACPAHSKVVPCSWEEKGEQAGGHKEDTDFSLSWFPSRWCGSLAAILTKLP